MKNYTLEHASLPVPPISDDIDDLVAHAIRIFEDNGYTTHTVTPHLFKKGVWEVQGVNQLEDLQTILVRPVG